MHTLDVRHRNGVRLMSTLLLALACATLLLWISPPANGQSADQQIDRDPSGAPYAAGELLVSYTSGTSEASEKGIVNRASARTQETLPAMNARLLSFPQIKDEASAGARQKALEAKMRSIEKLPGVEAVDYNYLRTPYWTPNDVKFGRQWGLKKTGFRSAWNKARGKGAKIAIVDTGVAKHPDIGKISAQRDFVNDDGRADDDVGHGTHVTGIAAALTNNTRGVAGGCPSCTLMIAKVLDAQGGYDSDIAKGINWSADRHADVINLSLGGTGKSAVLGRAVARAWRKGTVVVAAAGNEHTRRPSYPAAYPQAIAVGATNKFDKMARFSNRGSWVDLTAPGVSIYSTVPGSYKAYSGTSMASPHVAGLAGLLASQNLSARQIRARMQNTAVDLGPRGKDPYYGYGRINAARAVR